MPWIRAAAERIGVKPLLKRINYGMIGDPVRP
jgi:hypothetical protein